MEARLANAEKLILDVLQQNQTGLDDSQLKAKLGELSDQQRIDALNALVQKARVQVLQKGPGGVVFFRFVAEEHAMKLKDLSTEEQMVFNAISDAGTEGALPSQLKFVLNQNQAKANAVLKQLERSGLIKQINSLAKNGRKVWLLSELEPSVSVTGGLSGTQSFDINRVAVVYERVEHYVKKHSRVSHKELLVFIKQIGIMASDQLRDDDLNQVIQAMVNDQRIELVEGHGENAVYKAACWGYPGYGESDLTAYIETPCAHCKLSKECGPQNKINPQSCKYMQAWLELF